jgi:hypothetical protein
MRIGSQTLSARRLQLLRLGRNRHVGQCDVIQSSDKNLRPIGTSTGPDGALYVIDWHNPPIGHLQSHLRDSNSNYVHGRIYLSTTKAAPWRFSPRSTAAHRW